MKPLVLIRHARTRIDPDGASRDWSLAAGAETDSRILAEQVATDLAGAGIDRVVTSHEAKAIETGTIMAASWSAECTVGEGLHEHDRTGVPVMDDLTWQTSLKQLFAEPTATVLGRATAAEAAARFERGLRAVVSSHPADGLAVVTHGTVLALFVANHNRVEAYAFWQALKMPEALYLERTSFRLMGRPFAVGHSRTR